MTYKTGVGRMIATFLLATGLCLAEDEVRRSESTFDEEPGSINVSQSSRVRVGGFPLTGAYSRFSGAPPWAGPCCGHFSPYWGSYWHFPFREFGRRARLPVDGLASSEPKMGEIKLAAEPLTASVFLNEAYAGRVQDLRSIYLDAGVYNLKIETEGYPAFVQRVYALSGKSLTIEANLLALRQKVRR
ncbi:MAG: PEGA domain-containing protein [Acidimicrobiia bacterium]|nr:PEGA domain-containing protein [Acidimicrobiia bacterium]